MLRGFIAKKVPTVKQIIIRTTVTIALAELLIMSMFSFMPWQLNDYTEALLDAFLLVVLVTPIIYFWIIKSYNDAHKKITQELEASLRDLNNYKLVLDQHAIVANTDIKGNIIQVNDKFCEISQYSKQELLGKNHRLLNSGYHEDEFFQKMYKTINKSQVWHGEVCNRNKSGETYWVNTTVAQILSKDDKPDGFIAIRNDITKQKKSEINAKKMMSLLEATINSTDNGLLVTNLESEIIQVNKSFLTLWEIPEQLISQAGGQLSLNYIADKVVDGEQFINRVEAIYNNLHGCSHDLVSLKNGNILERTSKPMLVDEKATGRVWAFRDVTERIHFEQQQAFINQLTAVKLDIAKITAQSGSLCKRFDETLVKLLSLDFISKQPCAVIFELVDEKLSVIASKSPKIQQTMEYENILESFITKTPDDICNGVQQHHHFIDNKDEFITCYVAPLFKETDVEEVKLGYLMLFTEQSENKTNKKSTFIKEVAELLSVALIRENARTLLKEASAAAEQNSQLKSEFLASMSHEIRTPMNGVLGMLGLLQQSELTKDQHHKTSLAKSSAESLLVLINDILDFSKIEAGKLELEILDFDLRGMLGEFAESMALRAQEKDIEIILDVTQIECSMVKGDPGRIRQILTNLVGNALKFTSQGEVTIRAKVHEKEKGLHCFSCSIQDTGIGIPQEKMSSLFDSFSQVDASTTRKYGGTGLGLSICKQLSELMGGDVTVSSELGQGSCFTFNIEIEISENSQKVLPSIDISKLSLLIVDDNATNREVLRGQLELWGVTVTEADRGAQALQLCQQLVDNEQPLFDVAFLDMQMPEMDGEELGKKLHGHLLFKSIKLIMMTSISSVQEARYFSKIGFHGFFPKPTTTSDLFNALNVVMSDDYNVNEEGTIITHDYLSTLKFSQSVVEENTSNTFESAHFRLLLVEDNITNQLVAQGVLANFGLHTDVAANGLEALQSIAAAPDDSLYDLILMDCQMPEMDGYEATKHIRAGKACSKNSNIPIIAMTANAMQGDKEICLAAGMSDYLAKPIEPDKLLNKLNQWLNSKSISNNKVASKVISHQETSTIIADTSVNGHAESFSPSSHINEHWDKPAVLKRVMGKEKLLRALVESFCDEMPSRIVQLNDEVMGDVSQSKYHKNIQIIGHTIKGVAGNLGGIALQESANQLEMAAKQQKGHYQPLMEKLEQSYNKLMVIFDEFITSTDNTLLESVSSATSNEPKCKSLTVTSIEELITLFLTIKEKLEQSDYVDSEELKMTIDNYSTESFDNEYQRFLHQLEQFNIELALKAVEEILTKLEKNKFQTNQENVEGTL